jgi:hypothetical protein
MIIKQQPLQKHKLLFYRYPILSAIISTLFLAFFPVSKTSAAPPTISFNDRTLSIKTDRYEIDIRDGSIARLVTLLPDRNELTLATQPMNVNQLPNGIGSFYKQESEGKKQHTPIRRAKLPVKFPAQHPPVKKSQVTYRKIENGAELTYRSLHMANSDVLRQQFRVDSQTGDLVINQVGVSPNPGVFGICFSLINLKNDLVFIVPFFPGVKWGGDLEKGFLRTIAWSRFWTAAVVIGEVQNGGTFAVWAQDSKMRAKYFHFYNGTDAQGLSFESCEDAPYKNKKTAASIEWRFNTFAKTWQSPALRYKQWMVEAYDLEPRSQRSAEWINNIALFWPTGDFSSENLSAIKEKIDPKHVIIHNWGIWPQFNRKIPDYTPRKNDFVSDAQKAHEFGYHVGGYASMVLVDEETNPDIRDQYKLEYYYDGLYQSKPEKSKSWLVQIHPGSRQWQEFYIRKMKTLHYDYGLDLLYQDTSGGSTGSSGIVNGMTRAAAVAHIEDLIRKAMPNVALMGEFWTEINVRREDFALINYLKWFDSEFHSYLSKRNTVHPIVSYLFSEFCLRMAFSRPFRDIEQFHMEENINEVTGSIPYWNTSIGDLSGEAKITMERAKLWAEGFRPYFPEIWEDHVIAYMKNSEGKIVKYIADRESTYCYSDPGVQ